MRLLLLVAAWSAALHAQSHAAVSPDLKFEVASLKPTSKIPELRGIRPAPGGERYVANAIPLRMLLMVAYQVKPEQIKGGPGWVDSDLYDMNAKAERPSSGEELHMMLRNLLMERFKLQLHHETKEMPVYVLSTDAGGAKLTAHPARSAGDTWIDQQTAGFLHVKMTATSVPMAYLAWRLAQVLDRPVVDETGLKGEYDFTLTFTRDPPPGITEGTLLNGQPIDTSGPTVFAAVKDELGLRIKAEKGPADVLVIDHAEKPAAN